MLEYRWSHRQQNNLHHNYRKQIYSVYGAPSSGSTTEVLKSKSLSSPIYRHNEMSTKYNMISSVPMKLYKMQKSIDLFI